MSSRIDDLFADLKAGRKAFVAFITAGDPDVQISAEILAGLPAAGPILLNWACLYRPDGRWAGHSAASQRALAAGQTL